MFLLLLIVLSAIASLGFERVQTTSSSRGLGSPTSLLTASTSSPSSLPSSCSSCSCSSGASASTRSLSSLSSSSSPPSSSSSSSSSSSPPDSVHPIRLLAFRPPFSRQPNAQLPPSPRPPRAPPLRPSTPTLEPPPLTPLPVSSSFIASASPPTISLPIPPTPYLPPFSTLPWRFQLNLAFPILSELLHLTLLSGILGFLHLFLGDPGVLLGRWWGVASKKWLRLDLATLFFAHLFAAYMPRAAFIWAAHGPCPRNHQEELQNAKSSRQRPLRRHPSQGKEGLASSFHFPFHLHCFLLSSLLSISIFSHVALCAGNWGSLPGISSCGGQTVAIGVLLPLLWTTVRDVLALYSNRGGTSFAFRNSHFFGSNLLFTTRREVTSAVNAKGQIFHGRVFGRPIPADWFGAEYFDVEEYRERMWNAMLLKTALNQLNTKQRKAAMLAANYLLHCRPATIPPPASTATSSSWRVYNLYSSHTTSTNAGRGSVGLNRLLYKFYTRLSTSLSSCTPPSPTSPLFSGLMRTEIACLLGFLSSALFFRSKGGAVATALQAAQATLFYLFVHRRDYRKVLYPHLYSPDMLRNIMAGK